ncbi:hypothetical protein CIB48_g7252 [Xylaria polymorpha]|nr:hypothetical protein CIB48_g7252 [Xylaria polymorpha]
MSAFHYKATKPRGFCNPPAVDRNLRPEYASSAIRQCGKYTTSNLAGSCQTCQESCQGQARKMTDPGHAQFEVLFQVLLQTYDLLQRPSSQAFVTKLISLDQAVILGFEHFFGVGGGGNVFHLIDVHSPERRYYIIAKDCEGWTKDESKAATLSRLSVVGNRRLRGDTRCYCSRGKDELGEVDKIADGWTSLCNAKPMWIHTPIRNGRRPVSVGGSSYASWPKLAQIGSWKLSLGRAKQGAKVTHSVDFVTKLPAAKLWANCHPSVRPVQHACLLCLVERAHSPRRMAVNRLAQWRTLPMQEWSQQQQYGQAHNRQSLESRIVRAAVVDVPRGSSGHASKNCTQSS